ncbi:conserved hypothetical protein [Culex quinquefasciatus]|uniref:Uncharacterized protein n=1 Tax=Culex quinquefasciatus TaxID=7176 RepID=B0X381_CULQU|nr:conserved hypothetical protein [Culex quinquefasciatus]|eukprot:XP_001864103.1 conserved hypothetical protein [Culex quinquefasciatus]
MAVSYLGLIVLSIASSTLACIHPTQHYTTMGCIPSKEIDGTGCPRSYYCPNLSERAPDKCYLFGQVYDLGQQLPPDQTISNCATLTCEIGYDDKPWLSSNYENCIYSYSPDCVTQYSLNQCCPVGTVCGDDRDSLARCNVSGSSYYEGEQVYLGFDSGKSCVCSRYYDDSREGVVSCVEQKCNFEVFDSYRLLNGGAPVYREESFCPYDWRLPHDNDVIVPGPYHGDGSYPQCVYGNLTLTQGDSLISLITYQGIYKCHCAIPPLVHCILEKDTVNKK